MNNAENRIVNAVLGARLLSRPEMEFVLNKKATHVS